MANLLIHIGYPKTGTSYLQHFLTQNEDELRHVGIDYLKTGRASDITNHVRLVRALQDESKDIAIKTWHDVAEEVALSSAHYCVISAEAFAEGLGEEHIGILYELIKDIDVKILVYVRPQAQAIQSRYLQAIKTGFRLPDFSTYVKRQIRKGTWNYQERLGLWSSFGKDNLIVRPYIRSLLPKGDILEDFRITLGIPDYIWSTMSLPEGASQNLSIGPRSFAALKKIVYASDGFHRPSKMEVEQGDEKDFTEFLEDSRVLNRDLGSVFHDLGWYDEKLSLLTPEIEKHCIDSFADSNAFVARNYLGLDNGVLFPINSKLSSPTLIPDLTTDDWVQLAIGLLRRIKKLQHERHKTHKISRRRTEGESNQQPSSIIDQIQLASIDNEPLASENDLPSIEGSQKIKVSIGEPIQGNHLMGISSRPSVQPNPTIFHITHYKAGSQWVYAVMAAVAPKRIIQPQPGVKHVFAQPIEQGRIYPTVYLKRDVFDTLQIPGTYRRFIIIRDLRDTLISLYFSHRYSHGKTSDAIISSREMLNALTVRDGLMWLMDNRLKVSADILESWLGTNDLLIKYEQLLEDEYGMFERIINYCGIDISKDRLVQAVKSASFENITHRDKGEENVHAHQRKAIAGDWRNYFDEELKIKFKQKYGDLLIAAEYEKGHNW